MDPVVKAQRQLESIAGQIAQLEAKAGADEEARLKRSNLQHQIAFLREQIRAHVNAWQKTELARHSQRPFTQYPLTASSPTGARSTATALLATILPSSAAWPATAG